MATSDTRAAPTTTLRAGDGRVRKAIAEYRRILSLGSNDPQIHAKLAPLLAVQGDVDGAFASFRFAGDAYEQQGQIERAISLYRQAAPFFRYRKDLWLALGHAYQKNGQITEAVEALLEGRRNLRRRSDAPDAIALLDAVLALDPGHFDAVFDLSRLLVQTGDKTRAETLLSAIADRQTGNRRRRIRGALLRLSPTPTALWAWLVAILSSG